MFSTREGKKCGRGKALGKPGFPGTERDEDDEEDEEEEEGFDEDFMKQMDALKRACQMHVGDDHSRDANFGAVKPAIDLSKEEDEDDNALLLSVARAFYNTDSISFGVSKVSDRSSFGASKSKPAYNDDNNDDEEGDDDDDDDDDILRSVEKIYGGLDLTKATGLSLPNLDKVHQDGNQEVYGGPRIKSAVAGPKVGIGYHDRVWESKRESELLHKDLPESLQAVSDALQKNRQCQRMLRNLLLQVELKQRENKEMSRRACTLLDFEGFCKRKFSGFSMELGNPSVKLISTKPHTSITNGEVRELKVKGPLPNVDVEIHRKLYSQFPVDSNVRKWTQKERESLIKGVRQQVQECRLRTAMEEFSFDNEAQDFNEWLRISGEREVTAEDIREALPFINWDEVAYRYVVDRLPSDCKIRWINCEDPLVETGPWSKSEDMKLLSIAQRQGMVDWASIAQQLGTRRTVAQCFVRFQRSLNASILRSAWTLEEDLQLRAAVEKFGEDWQAVAASMEGRIGSQCAHRWSDVLQPGLHRRGRWQPEEDTRLKWAVSVYGARGWKRIATHVPGRSEIQCRERWCNVLDPSIKIEDWTPEENIRLKELVVKHGSHRWAAVASEMGCRTDNQCFRHWKALNLEHEVSFQKDTALRRAIFASNFVGRAKERPQLGLQDFQPPLQAVDNVLASRCRRVKSKKFASKVVKGKFNPTFVPRKKRSLVLFTANEDCFSNSDVPLSAEEQNRASVAKRQRKSSWLDATVFGFLHDEVAEADLNDTNEHVGVCNVEAIEKEADGFVKAVGRAKQMGLLTGQEMPQIHVARKGQLQRGQKRNAKDGQADGSLTVSELEAAVPGLQVNLLGTGGNKARAERKTLNSKGHKRKSKLASGSDDVPADSETLATAPAIHSNGRSSRTKSGHGENTQSSEGKKWKNKKKKKQGYPSDNEVADSDTLASALMLYSRNCRQGCRVTNNMIQKMQNMRAKRKETQDIRTDGGLLCTEFTAPIAQEHFADESNSRNQGSAFGISSCVQNNAVELGAESIAFTSELAIEEGAENPAGFEGLPLPEGQRIEEQQGAQSADVPGLFVPVSRVLEICPQLGNGPKSQGIAQSDRGSSANKSLQGDVRLHSETFVRGFGLQGTQQDQMNVGNAKDSSEPSSLQRSSMSKDPGCGPVLEGSGDVLPPTVLHTYQRRQKRELCVRENAPVGKGQGQQLVTQSEDSTLIQETRSPLYNLRKAPKKKLWDEEIFLVGKRGHR
ncbi:unnamed protein product [Sphagnum jensenii]|uniref:Uncharacterized protein n=1 Tax=Sphagnum jensenii TaxID=128206 RepID=A0ABP1B0W1_9BRYO